MALSTASIQRTASTGLGQMGLMVKCVSGSRDQHAILYDVVIFELPRHCLEEPVNFSHHVSQNSCVIT